MSVPENYKQFEGYLEKKSPGFLGGWQKRYFAILGGKVMVYYENQETKDKPKGQILFSQITEPVDSPEDSKKAFKFTLDNRDFLLKAPSIEAKNDWVLSIKKCREEKDLF